MSIFNDDEFTNRPELVQKRQRQIFWQRVGIGAIVLYCIASLTFVVILAINGTQQRNLLIDCTSPEGRCFKDGQSRTGEAVNGINVNTKHVVALSIACGDKASNDTSEEIEACVDAELQKEK